MQIEWLPSEFGSRHQLSLAPDLQIRIPARHMGRGINDKNKNVSSVSTEFFFFFFFYVIRNSIIILLITEKKDDNLPSASKSRQKWEELSGRSRRVPGGFCHVDDGVLCEANAACCCCLLVITVGQCPWSSVSRGVQLQRFQFVTRHAP